MKKRTIQLHAILLFVLSSILVSSFVVYAAQSGATPDEFSDTTFWKVIGGICTILMLSTAYQIRQRDKLLDKIAVIIYGDEDTKGLKTRVAVLEDEIRRCVGCNPNNVTVDTGTGGRRWSDPPQRKFSKTHPPKKVP